VTVGRADHGFHFRYSDGTDIWVDAPGENVWCTSAVDAALEDTATYLTGPVLAFVLRLRGALALHASAVEVQGRALLLVGPHGAGKSTAAAALGRRGCAIITDDVLHLRNIDDRWCAESFSSPLRLWDAGAILALGDTASLPRLTPTWDKSGLAPGTHGVEAARGPVPVGGIVLLGPRETSAHVPRLEPIGPAEALVRLATHSSSSHLLDTHGRAAEFHALSSLVRETSCTCAVSAETPETFDAFIDLLAAWAITRIEPPSSR
jgi:hypothetical protein